ncbi:PREDICTED: vomeronasal type-2 receptor 1-like [Nanorana parkeri]|uniref:vomeronasal type-2 receptor 1-like n=1 Tax=Nanorana parkeri TaxID=125878 RepID=UPI0008542CEF|nr:PREDICTED: vomeronasal type-2 receptor 1-like [Nanorana parkeri]
MGESDHCVKSPEHPKDSQWGLDGLYKTSGQYCVDQPSKTETLKGKSVTIPCQFAFPESEKSINSSRFIARAAPYDVYCNEDKNIYDSDTKEISSKYQGRLNVRFDLNHRNASITIINITKEDDAKYCCRILLSFHNMSDQKYQSPGGTLLIVKDGNEPSLETTSVIFAAPGDNVKILGHFTSNIVTLASNITCRGGRAAGANTGCDHSRNNGICTHHNNSLSFQINRVTEPDQGFYCWSVDISTNDEAKTTYTYLGPQLLITDKTNNLNITQPEEVEIHQSATINCSSTVQQRNDILRMEVYWMTGDSRESYVYHPNMDYIHLNYKGKTRLVDGSNLHIEDFHGPNNTIIYCRVIIRRCLAPLNKYNPNRIETIVEEGPGTRLVVKGTREAGQGNVRGLRQGRGWSDVTSADRRRNHPPRRRKDIESNPPKAPSPTLTIVLCVVAVFLVVFMTLALYFLKKGDVRAPMDIPQPQRRGETIVETMETMEMSDDQKGGDEIYQQANIDRELKVCTLSSQNNLRMLLQIYTVTCHILLSHLLLLHHCHGHQCRLDISELQEVKQAGDILIGVVLPLHLDASVQISSFTERPPRITCSVFHFESYQQFQAMTFAMEEINQHSSILPNVTLGFQAYDSCDTLHLDLGSSLQVLSGTGMAIPNYRCLPDIPLAAIIGPAISTHSILLAHILGLYKYNQISHFSTSYLLGDRRKFPSFFRTVPSDAFQSLGLAKLVLHFGWTWVGLLAADSDYGQQGIQLVRQELLKAGACVAFTENIIMNDQDRNAQHIVKVIRASTVKVIVAFSTDIELFAILEEMLRQNVTDITFVASEAWSTTSIHSIEKYSKLLAGTIGLAFYSGNIPGLKTFLHAIHPSMSLGRDWIQTFWEEALDCKFNTNRNATDILDSAFRECTGAESLENIHNSFTDVSNLRTTYNVYTAVHVVAKALEDLKNCNLQKGTLSLNRCANIYHFKPWQLLHYLKKARVSLSNGNEFYFDDNGEPPAIYDIVNWQLSPEGAMRQVKIGSYAAAPVQVLTINSSLLFWASKDNQVPLSICSESCPPGFWKAARQGEPICCFECVPCPLGEIANKTNSIDCSRCPWDQWPNSQKSKCLPKNKEYLSYDDPLGTSLMVISAISSLVPNVISKLFIKHKASPVVKANNYHLSILLLVSLTFCFLTSLAFIGYPQPEKCLLRQATFGMVFAICISCVLAKTIMVVLVFMATKPGCSFKKWTTPRVSYMIILIGFLLQFILCITWLSLVPPFPQYSTHIQSVVIIVECNEGSPIAFWAMLGYLFLLATISFIVAFLARRLPDSFNEAQFITFSMLAFLSVWVSYIPASLSAQGKYTVTMEIFAILASSWAMLICMFLPKCFIILFRPNLNSKEYIMRKNRLR